MFLGPTSKAATNNSASYCFSLCFQNPQELNTGFVEDKTNSKSFTFNRSAGLCGIVSTEEETARLKAVPSRRRLIFHPELSQFCHFLRIKKKKNQWHQFKQIKQINSPQSWFTSAKLFPQQTSLKSCQDIKTCKAR